MTEGSTRDSAVEAMAGVMEAWLQVAGEQGFAAEQESPGLVAAEIAFVLQYRAEENWDLTVETTVRSLTAPAH
ncbi:MAG: hypothetical protein ACR2HN_04955 [Tepidiformaceae bacterium]